MQFLWRKYVCKYFSERFAWSLEYLGAFLSLDKKKLSEFQFSRLEK
jgi:hypothetical protein